MKIGIDARSYGPKGWTGVGRYTQMLIGELAKKTDDSYDIFLAGEEYDNFKPKQGFQKKHEVKGSYYSFYEQFLLPFRFYGKGFDFVHFPHFNVPISYFGNFIVTIHDLIHLFFPGNNGSKLKLGLYKAIIGRAVKRSKKIIAVSEATKNDIIKNFNVDPSKVVVIYESVDKENYYKIKDRAVVESAIGKYGIPVDSKYILYTGVSRSHKNLLGLIRAFDLLLKKNPSLKLVLTGKKDPRYPEIDIEIQKLNLEKNIIRTGFVAEEDMVCLYNGASVFAFPSFYEGFGLPPLEAQACGVPVACSKVASIPEIVGEGGLYFDPKNIEDMANKIEILISYESKRQEIIQKGYENIKRFSWEKMGRETYEVYKEVYANIANKK